MRVRSTVFRLEWMATESTKSYLGDALFLNTSSAQLRASKMKTAPPLPLLSSQYTDKTTVRNYCIYVLVLNNNNFNPCHHQSYQV